MAFPGEIGWIGKNCPQHPMERLITTTMKSGAGWFIGTFCERCREEDPSPHSRESDYYQTREALVADAFAGRVRWRDTAFHGMKLDVDLGQHLVFKANEGPKLPQYTVHCHLHGAQMLTQGQYDAQMGNPNAKWACPVCGRVAVWDDEAYESWVDSLDKQAE